MSYPPPGGGYPPPGSGGYPPAPGGTGYPPPGGGYPPTGTGYPPPSGGGYPPAPGTGYPAPGGYPAQGATGYPLGDCPPPTGTAGYPPTGYPGAPPPTGYPGAPPPTGYPGAPPPTGYPAAPQTGYPAAPQTGYPAPSGGGYPAQAGSGYAPPGGYSTGAPPTVAGYPSQPGVPPVGGPVPQAQGYAPPPATSGTVPPAAQYSQPPQQGLPQMQALSLQPSFHGTVKPISPFDAENDSEILRKAMKGFGTDEKAIINIITTRSNKQRQEIEKMFLTMFGKHLKKDLMSELSGNLEECVTALFEETSHYDAFCLRTAMKGAGTDEESLIDILCTRTNQEIHAIKAAYKQKYSRDLEKDCVSETSGHFKRLLVSMCQGNRDESGKVDMEKARKDANDLYQAGEKKWGTDESRFNVVLATRNFGQLRATYAEYIKISQRDILNSIDREMDGDLQRGFTAIVQCSRNPGDYFAERLYKSMKGAGTDDHTLIRIIVSRSEIDLVEIKQAFLQRYQKTLCKMVEGDCSGDYKKLLCGIVGTN